MRRGSKKKIDPAVAEPLKPYLRPGLAIEDLIALKECFDIFDYKRTGQISLLEIKKSIATLEMEEDTEKMLLLMTLEDRDSLTFEEFLALFGYTSDYKTDRCIRLLFEQFDIEKQGFITLENFRDVCEQLGENYSSHELRHMIEQADLDRDDRISYEEFVKVMTRKCRA